MGIAAFTFSIADMPTGDSLVVNHFTGEEGISQNVRIEIDFNYVTTSATGTPDGLVGKAASLGIDWGAGTVRTIHGRIDEIRMGKRLQSTNDQNITEYAIQCRATLTSWLHLLTKSHRSRVFQEQNVLTIIESVLTGAGFIKNTHFKIEIVDATVFDVREYCMQYDESDFNFISRLMEDEGLFYFFDHSGASDVLIITDKTPSLLMSSTTVSYASVGTYPYLPNRGGLVAREDEVWEFLSQSKALTGHVQLLGYNYEDFNQEYPLPGTLEQALAQAEEDYQAAAQEAAAAPDNETLADAEAQAAANVEALKRATFAHGQFFREGRDFSRPKNNPEALVAGVDYPTQAAYDTARTTQVDRLATVRLQEVNCQRKVFTGLSECARFVSGYPFTLGGYYGSADPVAGEPFLITRITHFGGEATSVPSEIESTVDPNAVPTVYYNAFTCIKQSVPYRAPRVTPVPQAPGILTARIGSQGNNVVDTEGRYVVRMPFEGSVGTVKRLRMAQPYSGPDYGIHFPNPAGAEAVVAFIEGDIDRPIILSTLPNAQHHTPTPNTNLKVPTQKKVSEWGPGGDLVDGEEHFREEKKVIQTEKGHRLVMDDGDAGSNVGITLQVGSSKPSGYLVDAYWNSRIDMGGYRRKTHLERVLDSWAAAQAWLGLALKSKRVPELAGLLAGLIASQVTTGNYLADTFGGTAPVGIALGTDQDIKIVGQNGVNIVAPNIFGVVGGGMFDAVLPGLSSQGSHRLAWSLTNFLIDVLFQDLFKERLDEFNELKEKSAQMASKPAKVALWGLGWEMKKKLAYCSSVMENFLQIPGVNLKSAGGINLGAMSKVTIAGGFNGIELASSSKISQNAKLDIDLESDRGITIKAGGNKGAKSSLLGAVPTTVKGVAAAVKLAFGASAAEVPPPKAVPIKIINEQGDIRLLAEKNNIINYADQNIGLVSEKGNIEGSADHGHVRFKSGGSYLWMGDADAGVHLSSGKKIIIQTGKSSIILAPDGKVTIKGTEVTIDGSNKVTVGGKEVSVSGNSGITIGAQAAPSPPPIYPPEPPEADLQTILAWIQNPVGPHPLEPHQQWEEQVSNIDAFVESTPLTKIELKPTSVKVISQLDVGIECVTYKAEAKAIAEMKGALAKIN
ncbi:MAG: contractile injection system protein, VgrG/Pvc8 family [Rhodothermales bacterium]